MVGEDPVLSVSQFVGVFNQSVQYMYPRVGIIGELANFRISRNRWVYFDLKDEVAIVKFFGGVEQLPGPLEDGMMLEVFGIPNLHVSYGFSVNVTSLRVVGRGSIKKAQNLLALKLQKDGLFEESRKRALPFAPSRIGVITSEKSAAFADFGKLVGNRWGGCTILVADVKVQGSESPQEIVSAIKSFNELAEPVDVLVIIRGGGSPEDLASFSDESVVRAVASSRSPTLVAVGHETDSSLAELAADVRASTPSNAAELAVPNKKHERSLLSAKRRELINTFDLRLKNEQQSHRDFSKAIDNSLYEVYLRETRKVAHFREIISALDPKKPLLGGYAIVRNKAGRVVKDTEEVVVNERISITLSNGTINGRVE